MRQSTLERTFETLWRQLGGPPLEPEYRFHPKRRWRLDFALPEAMIAVELEGGTFSGGRHTRGKGYSADCHKYNEATRLGWRVFRFTADMLRDDPFGHIAPVVAMGKPEP